VLLLLLRNVSSFLILLLCCFLSPGGDVGIVVDAVVPATGVGDA